MGHECVGCESSIGGRALAVVSSMRQRDLDVLSCMLHLKESAVRVFAAGPHLRHDNARAPGTREQRAVIMHARFQRPFPLCSATCMR